MRHLQTIALILSLLTLSNCSTQNSSSRIEKSEYERVIQSANKYLKEKPVTITNFSCERSHGAKNDFYSEGDYWWPDPENPEGPYIRRDGQSNPENFNAHRLAMRNMSVWVPALVAAYKLTGDTIYAERALEHLSAWFIVPETRMNPNLLYGQAIKGRVSGRGIGIIDTIHLIEVAKAIEELMKANFLDAYHTTQLTEWFRDYNNWLTTHPYGIAERDHGNNHSAWWVAQVAAFSHLTSDTKKLNFCREFFKNIIIDQQLDTLGRFTDELTRTKPYSYSLFNLEAFALNCQLLSTEKDNLWEYSTSEGKGTRTAFQFMFPYISDKTKWPYPPDVEHFDELPVRGSALLFGGIAYRNDEYIDLWNALSPELTSQELIRTFVIRQPVLWVD